MSPRRFLCFFGLMLLVTTGGAAAFNLVVDPYDIWNVVELPFLPAKAEVRFHDRAYLAAQVKRRKPDFVLLGSSRVQIGLPTEHPAYGASVAQNLGLPGATMYEVFRYLQHAHAVRPVRVAVIGLDPLMFDGNSRRTSGEFSEARLAADEAGERNPWMGREDVIPTLLSFDALRSSIKTLIKRGRPPYLTPAGERAPAFMEAEFKQLGGAREMFRLSDRSYFAWFRCYRLPGPADPPHFADLQSLFDFARAQNIQLKLYLSPVHVRQLELTRLAGKWADRNAWLTKIVDQIAAEQQRWPEGALELWDFSGPSETTMEPLPPRHQPEQRMQNYWDTSHYSPRVGGRVLEHLLLGKREEGFAVLLTPATLPARLEEQKAALDRWAQAHPDAVQELRTEWWNLLNEVDRQSCEGVRDTARLDP